MKKKREGRKEGRYCRVKKKGEGSQEKKGESKGQPNVEDVRKRKGTRKEDNI